MKSGSEGTAEEPPSDPKLLKLKEFRTAGRGFWNNVSDENWNDWRWQLKNRITTVEQLEKYLPSLTPEERAGTILANSKLSMAITPYFFNLIDPTDELCPIRRQVIPRIEETNRAPWEMSDPCGEDSHSPVPGLVHRYPDRVLFLVTDRPLRRVLPILHPLTLGEQRRGLRFSSGVRKANRVHPEDAVDSRCAVERWRRVAPER